MTDHPELEQLSAFLDGELDAAEQARMQAHVASCAECTRTLDALRATIADVAALPPVEMSPQQLAALDVAIAAERASAAQSRERYRRIKRLGWASGGVAAALIAVVVLVQSGGTLSHKATSAAPQGAAGAQGGGTSEALRSNADYDETSAKQLLVTYAASRSFDANPAGQQAGSGGAGAKTTVPSQPEAFAAAPGGLVRCDEQVRASSSEGLQTRLLEVARFKGAPAYVLVYAAPAAKPSRVELWIVRPSDCFVLFFTQTRLS